MVRVNVKHMEKGRRKEENRGCRNDAERRASCTSRVEYIAVKER